jgi:hypothetical protein
MTGKKKRNSASKSKINYKKCKKKLKGRAVILLKERKC